MVHPSTNQETQYMIKRATELMRVRRCHVIYISQWLKFGGGKLIPDSGMKTFSKTGVRTTGWVTGTFKDSQP
jgi:hypothetical protein